MNHLNDEQLIDLTLGRHSVAVAAEIDAHVKACVSCKARQESLASVVLGATATPASETTGIPTVPGSHRSDRLGSDRLVRGTLVGRYVVLEALGSGGMGQVYAAYDPQLDRRIALKLLRSGSLSAEEGRVRLLREAQALARLAHPHVIAVHDVGTYGEGIFIAMEFVDGEPLSEWLRGQRHWREIVEIFLQAGHGLAAAHRAGLIHRDFKPDNVLIGEDKRVRVLDFGLARQAAQPLESSANPAFTIDTTDSPFGSRITQDGALMGTPAYMAPEQIDARTVEARSDQFSFCVALYEALFGQRPFSGNTLREVSAQIALGRIALPPPGVEIPESVFEVLQRGLKADPSARFPSMEALLSALSPKPRRQRRLFALMASLAFMSISGVSYGVWSRQQYAVCGGADVPVAAFWDAGAKKQIKSKFLETRAPYAESSFANIETRLGTWANEWARSKQLACEATHVRKIDSEEVFEQRQACLDDRLLRFRALIDVFAAADAAIVMNAPAAVRGLPQASNCLDARLLLQKSPSDLTHDEIDPAFRARYLEASALFSTAQYSAAAAKIEPLLTPALGDRSMAMGALLLGKIATQLGDERRAKIYHQQAAECAIRLGDAALEARALTRLYAAQSNDPSSYDLETFDRLAHAAATRAGDQWEVIVELAQSDAVAARSRHQLEHALDALERALEIQTKYLGSEHPDVATTLQSLGQTLMQLGRFDQAVKRYDACLKLREALEGPEHPHVALAAHQLGVLYSSLGHYAQARHMLDRALVIREKSLGRSNTETVATTQELARVLIAQDELTQARSLIATLETRSDEFAPPASAQVSLQSELLRAGGDFRGAFRAAERELSAATSDVKSNSSRRMAQAHLNAGLALTKLANQSDARRHLLEARRLFGASLGKINPQVANADDALGHLERASRRGPEALQYFSEALEIRKQLPLAAPVALAESFLQVGRSQLENLHPLDAIDLLAQAEEGFETLGLKRKLAQTQVLRGQALWLARKDARGDAVELFMRGMPEIDPTLRSELTDWLATQRIALDADGGTAQQRPK